MIELTDEQKLKIYKDFQQGQALLCQNKEDAFIRGVQYALRHIKGGEWKE